MPSTRPYYCRPLLLLLQVSSSGAGHGRAVEVFCSVCNTVDALLVHAPSLSCGWGPPEFLVQGDWPVGRGQWERTVPTVLIQDNDVPVKNDRILLYETHT